MAKRKASSKSANKRRSSSRQTQRPSLAVWVFALVLIVGLIAGMSYLNQPSHKKSTHPWADVFKSLKKPASVAKAKTVPKPKPKPEFEFYTALPEGGLQPVKAPVSKPVAATSKSATPVPPIKPAPTTTATTPATTVSKMIATTPAATTSTSTKPVTTKATSYFLQVASFPKFDDANHLRAKLLLEAYNANIQKTSVNGKDWYRVVVGPYNDSASLNQAQNNLAKMHYKTITLQAK
jgi:cell division protein FtsN